MKIAIAKERKEGELRVSASPETVKKIRALGAEVYVEKGAGENSSLSDELYKQAGAVIVETPHNLYDNADIIFKVQPPFENINETQESNFYKKGALVIGLFSPYENKKQIEELASKQINAFALEFIPRITRAQSMDVLSSQSNLAGYKAVLDAVNHSDKVVPMMMTAAGTVQPAKALILGAGVAGLQAIATAKRLGAVVSAFDVRPVVKEQVESLGAKFIEVVQEKTEDAETKGGYAKEMSKEYQMKQRDLIHETIKSQDIVITTALIPGKPAPKLITRQMVDDMKDGSVIVDLAAPAGGNCEYTVPGQVIKQGGVTIVGYENIPSRVARDASLLYSRNLFNLFALLFDKQNKTLKIDLSDEIVKGSLITYQGKTVHPALTGEAAAKANSEEQKPVKKDVPEEAPPKKVLENRPHLKKRAKSPKKPARKEGQEIKEEGQENAS